jgi:hypothetical protein
MMTMITMPTIPIPPIPAASMLPPSRETCHSHAGFAANLVDALL